MNCNRVNAEYYVQLENGTAEMEATIERLRMEIHELLEMKDALNQFNSLLKKELIDQVGDLPF